jgi:capsular polysaccharide biosynthesis protein
MGTSKIKEQAKSVIIKGVNAFGVSSKYIGCPKSISGTGAWIEEYGTRFGAKFIPLLPSVTLHEPPPATIETEVHKIFRDEYEHVCPEAFVAIIPGARVWGRNGTVIAPNDILLGDVSREFGAYGGIMGKAHSINRQLHLHKCTKLKGKIAILGTAGTYNYHHWLFDTAARVHLLKKAGLFDQVEFFIIDYNELSFQKESLKELGIPVEKIIRSNDNWRFHVEAETLIIPSLPSRLGRVGEWPVTFLRSVFLQKNLEAPVRLYISRRKAPSRKLVNEEALFQFLQSEGFIEFFPEDHSIVETAAYFSSADFIVGVHGSGFANLTFLNQGAKVIDIVAPLHLDPYYWMLTNRNGGSYGYLFGEGGRVEEDKDLVTSKIDHDLVIDLEKFRQLFNLL